MTAQDYIASCGNVFLDLNLPEADDLMVKAELAAKILAEIQDRRMTPSQAAAILRIDQPKIAALKQGKLSSFSFNRTVARGVRDHGLTALTPFRRPAPSTAAGKSACRKVCSDRATGSSGSPAPRRCERLRP